MSNIEEKIDRIIRVVTRTEVKVEALELLDAEHRLTTLETTQKNIKYLFGMAMALPAAAFSALKYFKLF